MSSRCGLACRAVVPPGGRQNNSIAQGHCARRLFQTIRTIIFADSVRKRGPVPPFLLLMRLLSSEEHRNRKKASLYFSWEISFVAAEGAKKRPERAAFLFPVPTAHGACLLNEQLVFFVFCRVRLFVLRSRLLLAAAPRRESLDRRGWYPPARPPQTPRDEVSLFHICATRCRLAA